MSATADSADAAFHWTALSVQSILARRPQSYIVFRVRKPTTNYLVATVEIKRDGLPDLMGSPAGLWHRIAPPDAHDSSQWRDYKRQTDLAEHYGVEKIDLSGDTYDAPEYHPREPSYTPRARSHSPDTGTYSHFRTPSKLFGGDTRFPRPERSPAGTRAGDRGRFGDNARRQFFPPRERPTGPMSEAWIPGKPSPGGRPEVKALQPRMERLETYLHRDVPLQLPRDPSRIQHQ